ncbi:MAG: 30S ribosomal protein S1 [Planctomycetia bacterium]
MVNRSLLRSIDLSFDDEQAELEAAFAGEDYNDLPSIILGKGRDFEIQQIVTGRITRIIGDDVVIDIGFKSEGIVDAKEWDIGEPKPKVGEDIEVLLEGIEEDGGVISLSKRKADRIRRWERVISQYKEGDVVSGKVTRKIKGGLLVDIGVNVFLPASQVDIRRPNDIGDYLGQDIECLILKIDEARKNIVVSRRQLIERERTDKKRRLLSEIEIGQRRKGVVKNIAEFGAFVDLGGIDGLLHITDMSWGRIGHPSEIVRIDEEIEVVILNVDRDREKIALGLKQKDPSPWDNVEAKYPVGAKVKGEVVNVMSYGAFVKLEEGIEGLVHISEMSWTKRINHPSELVQVGDAIEVMVLGINKGQQEISLGIKQCFPNPWEEVAQKYPPGTVVRGKVRNLTNYGAFIEIEEGIDGLLHVTDISWVRKVGNPSEILEKGQQVECQVLSVDQERKRIALGMKQLKPDPWQTDIPKRYASGQNVKGKVTKLTNFGVFVELEPGLEGLLHISELADHKVEGPEQIVKVGQDIECRVLRVDTDERKIGLSRKSIDKDDKPETGSAAPRVDRTPGSRELKGGGGGGLFIERPSDSEEGGEGGEGEAEAEAVEEPAEIAPTEEPTEVAPTEEPTEEAQA